MLTIHHDKFLSVCLPVQDIFFNFSSIPVLRINLLITFIYEFKVLFFFILYVMQ